MTDLNDFITPAQACIKPGVSKEPGGASVRTHLSFIIRNSEPYIRQTEIQIDLTGSYYEITADPSTQLPPSGIGVGRKLEQAQISLNDCLACSGCITSAESVLITLQSHTEVLSFLSSNPPPNSPDHKIPVISIAPQSLASLSASLSFNLRKEIGMNKVYRRVQKFCEELGFEHSYDTTFARHLSLLEHTTEFLERKHSNGKLPMIASACPGWICYAEKAHAEMLPFIARTKSSQQVMGVLVKEYLARMWGRKYACSSSCYLVRSLIALDCRPDQIYHVTVMPCYDKKLEASRQDFHNDIYSTRDVDCVITTGELEVTMREKGFDLSLPVPGEDSPNVGVEFPELMVHPGTSSGSYLHSLINFQKHISPTPLDLSVKTIRSSDYEEYTLKNPHTNEIIFKGAKCYGFRNLQNIVRKVGREAVVAVGKGAAGRAAVGLRARVKRKTGAEGWEERGLDYVEVMACPGGCVNGGGQLKPPTGAFSSYQDKDAEGYTRNWEDSGVEMGVGASQNAKWGDKEWTKRVERAYWHDRPTPPSSPEPDEQSRVDATAIDSADALASRILVDLCRPAVPTTLAWTHIMDAETESRRRTLFRTEYRAVESEVVGLAVKW